MKAFAKVHFPENLKPKLILVSNILGFVFNGALSFILATLFSIASRSTAYSSFLKVSQETKQFLTQKKRSERRPGKPCAFGTSSASCAALLEPCLLHLACKSFPPIATEHPEAFDHHSFRRLSWLAAFADACVCLAAQSLASPLNFILAKNLSTPCFQKGAKFPVRQTFLNSISRALAFSRPTRIRPALRFAFRNARKPMGQPSFQAKRLFCICFQLV